MGDKAQTEDRDPHEKPQVFGVDFATDRPRFTHRQFAELIAIGGAGLGFAVAGCAPPASSPSPTPTESPSPTPTLPGNLGTIPPGVPVSELQVDGITQWIKCGTPKPANAVCTCDCVSASQPEATPSSQPEATPSSGTQVCTCDTVCSCVGDTGGGSHYWYPN